ncbi:hypothetical protein B0O99DRAFT_687661 [Bisporella sp. PMI_857]|nr:hypothetical protein B0O99DRAFT_687661 [Bisporella sp. PMI_857]
MVSASNSSSESPAIPERKSSKRATIDLEKDFVFLKSQAEDARKKIKPSHSFDSSYWTTAASAMNLRVEACIAETKLAARCSQENSDSSASDWWKTDEAREIVDRMKAATFEKKIYEKQAERIKSGGSIRRCFVALFTTSQIGIGALQTGTGHRPRLEQARFKKGLFAAYDGARGSGKQKATLLWDIGTGRWLRKDLVRAAHLVPHTMGKDFLNAMFGPDVENELNSYHNGLLLDNAIEKAMDDGAIAIVPDVPDDPSDKQVLDWETKEPKQYKWRVIDGTALSLDEVISSKLASDDSDMDVRALDHKPLVFRNSTRPRARYLYYLFVVAVLKRAWRFGNRKDPTILGSNLSKGFWGTRGRYLKKSFLLALSDEIGHDTSFINDMAMPPADVEDGLPDETGLLWIAKVMGRMLATEVDGSDEEGVDESDEKGVDESDEDEVNGHES